MIEGQIGFVIAAYAVSAVIACALVAWVLIDSQLQAGRLAELEQRGIGRRASPDQAAKVANSGESGRGHT
jgi:hypothetical protein